MSSNCFLFFSFLSIFICCFRYFLYHIYFCTFLFPVRKCVLDRWYIHITVNDLKAIHIVFCSMNGVYTVQISRHVSCTIYLYFHARNYDLKYLKKHRAKSKTPFPSSTCIINCPNTSNWHLSDSFAYRLSSYQCSPSLNHVYLLKWLLCPVLCINVLWIRQLVVILD